MFLRNHSAEFSDSHSTLVRAGVLRWNDEVNSVREITNLLLDPVEIDFELFVRVPCCPENPKTTGFGDGSHHVTTMTEGKNRNVDSEHVGDSCSHDGSFRVRNSDQV